LVQLGHALMFTEEARANWNMEGRNLTLSCGASAPFRSSPS